MTEGVSTGSVNVVLAGAPPVAVGVAVTAGYGPGLTVKTAPQRFSAFGGCPVVVAAEDPSGVASVVVEYPTPTGTAVAPLSSGGGSAWSGDVAVGSPVRTVTWRVVATDTLGYRTSSADLTTTVSRACL